MTQLSPEFIVNISMREWEVLRVEVVSTVERQYSIANWAITAVAVMIGALVTGWPTLVTIPWLLSSILVFLIPAVLSMYVVTWSHVITKINQLGARMYEIEENIAKTVSSDQIKRTFNLNESGAANPFRYLLGWEHKLWKRGKNVRVGTTIFVVKMALALIYVGFIGLNAILMGHHLKLGGEFTWWITYSAAAVWTVVWFSVFRYLHERVDE